MAIRGSSDRETLTVARHEGRWAVEHQGQFTDHTSEKEEAKAAANKRARALQDQGRPCQVRVSGEQGFFADVWACRPIPIDNPPAAVAPRLRKPA